MKWNLQRIASVAIVLIAFSKVSIANESLQLIPLSNDSEQFLLIESNDQGPLVLGPNESFFPKLGLKADGGASPESVAELAELNGGKAFAEIRGWDKGDVAEWGIWCAQAGEVEVRLDAVGPARFVIRLGQQQEVLRPGGSVRFTIGGSGQYTIQLLCTQADRNTAVQRLVLIGDGAEQACVIRKRWRPSAAHTKFHSSEAPKSVRLWIMEMDAVPGELGFYSPITTPFGYYGPTWNADGTVNVGFNFSLWSYGRNQPEPPIEQLSHLIAIGNREASFGGFGHEGTGVKIRDWQPLMGRQGQRQAIALRVEPGATYDTYFSYFYATNEHEWRLFGAGKKFHRGKSPDSLWVGSFVEVPGPPQVQRTGVYPRRMRYRGWVMDANEHWYRLDRMTDGNIDRETGLTHTHRGVTHDGWFFLETGGWTFRKPLNGGKEIELPTTFANESVEYLSPEKRKALTIVPCEIVVTNVRPGEPGTLDFNVRGAGTNSEVTIYWGSDEGLTFADRWQHSAKTHKVVEGANRAVLPGISTNSKVRLLIKNDAGQFWSNETLTSP